MRGPVGLRGLASYAGAAALLAATVAVLAAGTTLAVALTDGGGGRAATVLPLLVVALVVVPVPAVELARRRRRVTTLARVRGAGEARLLATTGGPGAAAALAGGVAGTILALAAVPLLPDSWDVAAGGPPLGWAAAGVAGAALLALACARLVARESLAGALRRPVRAPGGGLARLVATVAVLVATAASLHLARGDGGLLVLAGSGVVGLAAGELLVRGLALAGPLAEGRRSTGVLLGLRRVGATETSGRLRALAAAGVVVAAALSATTAAQDWAQTSERVRLGAPLQVALPGTAAVEALQLTRRLDPDGRWLMAGAVRDERPEAGLRVVLLDLARVGRVAEGFLASTPAGVGSAVDDLTDGVVVEVVTGEEVSATVSGAGEIELTYLDPAGLVATAALAPTGSTGRATAPVDCADGCVVLALSATAPVTLAALDLGGTDLLAAGWTPQDATGPASPPGPLRLTDTVVVPAPSLAPAPVLTAGDPTWEDGPLLVGLAGEERAAVEVGTREALPLVGAAGVLADLPVALAGAGTQGSAVRTVVLARADTPPDVLAALADAGADPPRGPGRAEDGLGARRASELRARTVVAGAAALLGALVLLAGARRRTGAARRDRAALRLVGVDDRELRTAALVESAVTGLLAAVAVAVGGLLVSLAISPGVGLVPTGPALLGLGRPLSLTAVAAAALGAGLLTALSTSLTTAATRRGSGSAPVTLLDEDLA